MKNTIVLLVHLLAALAVLLGTGGTRAVLAESILLKQQLLVLQRSRRRAPNLRTAERLLFGFCSQFLSPRRLIRAGIILKPATLLRFHRGFKDFKYRFLYSSSPKPKPGPTGPSPELIRAICELKRRNPRFGCSNTTTTRRACTKGYPATRPGRKRAIQQLRQPALRITAGKATATDCLNCQSPLEWQFAMRRHTVGSLVQYAIENKSTQG